MGLLGLAREAAEKALLREKAVAYREAKKTAETDAWPENPAGISGITAAERAEALRKKVGPQKYAAMAEMAQNVYRHMAMSVNLKVQAGILSTHSG